MWASYFRVKPASAGAPANNPRSGRNGWIRTSHRWISIAFTLTVLANFVAMGLGHPPAWITFSPLLPLALLMLTGLYLFALPFASLRRGSKLQQ